MAKEKKPVHKVQMTEGKRNIIQMLLQEYDIESAQDIQDALKDLLGGTIKEMMEAEMDDHLGYPIILNDGTNIGYVQACSIGEDFEIGYHVAQKYTGNGYATEAVKIFLPVILETLQIDKIYGIVLEENVASHKILEKNGFKLIYKGIDQYQGKNRKLKKYIFEK